MIGATEGELNVYHTIESNQRLIWSRSGSQGVHYQYGRIFLESNSTDVVHAMILEVISGGFQSDVYLDNFVLRENSTCDPPTQTEPFFCDFEDQIDCGFTLDSHGGIAFHRTSGIETDPYSPGPDYDHSYQSQIGNTIIQPPYLKSARGR